MLAKIKNLFDDDSGVSPVIGVILMVAITVILAAVIASFVLGLGDQTDDVSPNMTFEDQYDVASGQVNSTTISVDTTDGDVDPNNIIIRGSALVNDVTWEDASGSSDTISAGDSVTLNQDGSNGLVIGSGNNDGSTWNNNIAGEEIVIVFETDNTSDTLTTIEIPEQ